MRDWKIDQWRQLSPPEEHRTKILLEREHIYRVARLYVRNAKRTVLTPKIIEVAYLEGFRKAEKGFRGAQAPSDCEPSDVYAAVTGWTEGQIESLMFSEIVSAWTDFEIMAGDLWEAAVNMAPSKLAHSAHGLNWGHVKEITRGTFSLDGRVGALLRMGQKFDRLGDMRKAYANTFTEHRNGIDGALNSPAVSNLNVVRNLIVHKGGTIDQDYVDAHRSIPGTLLPTPTIGQIFPVDGDLVYRLVQPAIDAGIRLIQAVDSWLEGHAT
jgi:hypothetical protein